MKCFIYCRKSTEAEDRQVMSLASQADEIERLIAGDTNLTIVHRYEEAYSAKQPGRPLFDEMLKRVERGEAEAILAWHPDRLARNAMDGGRIIHLLDQGKLKNLRFCSYAFENSSQGKFMLAIIFGYSKYYVDNLSENVKRGLHTKVQRGWRPNLAPIGYRNCKETGTIVPDGEHFTAVKRMFDLLLTGHYTVPEIHRIVCNDWGYTTPALKTRGGKKLARSTLYRVLSNPFYAGYLPWNGELHPGAHQPVVSKSEFERAQKLLGKVDKPRPKQIQFDYAGMFKCGACGLSVTAERKRKPSGREYIYYHCTRVHRSPACTEPSIEGRELDKQVNAFLERVRLPESIAQWFSKELGAVNDALIDAGQAVVRKLKRRVADLKKQLDNLTDLRVRELVGDEEFTAKRQTLRRNLGEAEEQAYEAANRPATFEPLKILQILLNRASSWLAEADARVKRELLQILCSNPTIKDKKASFSARKPFVELAQLADYCDLRGDLDDVRRKAPNARPPYRGYMRGDIDDVRNEAAICACRRMLREKLHVIARDKETIEVANEARALIERIEPELLEQLRR